MTRRPHPLATAAGLVTVLTAVGFGIAGVGWLIGHVSDALFGATR